MSRTVEATLFPDGTLSLPADDLPLQPVPVRVTFLDAEAQAEHTELASMGDYLARLEDYEEALARGEIQWK